jgi:hypothetical protein
VEYYNNPVILTQPSQISIASVSATDPDCYDSSDGTILVDASGGTGTLEYSIDDGMTYNVNSGFFSGLPGGTYNVWVRDANDCEVEFEGNPVTVDQPAQLEVTDVSAMNPLCFNGMDGSIDIAASGGSGTFMYSIDNGVTYLNNNGLFLDLPAGTYNIMVKDENDCEAAYANNPVVIGQPDAIAITEVSTTNPTCYGEDDGTLTVTASGGTGMLSYSIDGGATFMQNGGMFTMLGAGSYNVIVKDENDCELTFTSNPVVIGQPETISIADIDTAEPLCNGALMAP